MAEESIDDLLEYEGIFNEKALRFRKTKTVAIMMSIDPDTGSDDVADKPRTQGHDDDDANTHTHTQHARVCKRQLCRS